MKLYKKSYVKAKKVLVDDYVKIAGLLYRVTQVLTHEDDVELSLRNIASSSRHATVLIIPKHTLMKIRNQA